MATVTNVNSAHSNATALYQQSSAKVDAILADLLKSVEDIGGVFNRSPDIDYARIGPLNVGNLGVVDPSDKPGGLDISAYINALATAPQAPTLGTLSAPDIGTLPDLTATSPTIGSFASPAPFTPDDDPDQPIISDITIPAAPDVALPEVPTFDAFVLPDTPEFSFIPAFDESAPVLDVNAPAPVIVFNEEEYTSELKDRAEAWLQNIIVNGGTGLNAAVEQAIWERGMAREVLAARRNIENAIDEFAASGFPAPPGALHARTESIRQDLQNRAEDLSRTIMEEQARLAQNNTQFAVQQGIGFIAMEMEHHRAIMERAFQLARATAEIALAVFNARITAYNAQIEQYRTKVQVFETNVRAALQQLEQYRTLLEGKRIEASLRQQEVDLYRAQISGAEALFGLYRTRLEGVRTQVEVDRGRVDLFRALIEGQSLKVKMKEAEYGLYRAQLDGEKTKVELYQSQVDAYRSRVQAEATKYDMYKSQFDAEVKFEGLKVEEFKAKILAYTSEIEKNKVAISALLDEYRSDNDVYRAQIQKATEESRLAIELQRLEMERGKFNVSELNTRYRLIAELAVQETNARLAGYSTATTASANVASAALSMVNTIANMTLDETPA